MQGMPSISGTSGFAAVVVNGEPEFGTMNGTQVVVNASCSSPDEQPWASGLTGSAEKAAIVGAAAAARVNAPITMSRRTAIEDVVMPRF